MTRAQLAGAGAAIALLGFAAGRFAAPARVVEHTRTVHDAITIAGDGTSSSAAAASAIDRSVEETKHPDGTVTIVKHDVVYRDRVKTVDVVHQVVVEKKSDQAAAREISRPAPSWRVGILAGLTTSSSRIPVTKAIPGIPGFVPLDAGVTLERRVAGPIWAGAWASSDKSAGVMVSVEF